MKKIIKKKYTFIMLSICAVLAITTIIYFRSHSDCNIRDFLLSIDRDKYYGGSFREGSGWWFVYDEDNNRMKDQDGRQKRYWYDTSDIILHVLLTDISIVPRALKNCPEIVFHEVRYSLYELRIFEDKIFDNLMSIRTIEGYYLHDIVFMGIDIEKNQIEIGFLEGFGIGLLHALVPADAIYYFIVDNPDGW